MSFKMLTLMPLPSKFVTLVQFLISFILCMLAFLGAIVPLPYYSLLQTRLRLQTPEGINLDFFSNSQKNLKEVLNKTDTVFAMPYQSVTPEDFADLLTGLHLCLQYTQTIFTKHES